MVESLFIYLLYNNSTRWAETDRTEEWWSLVCYCFQHLLTGKHGNHLIVLLTLWNPCFHCREHGCSFPWDFPPTGLEAWLGCLDRASNPRTGWSPRISWGSDSPWTALLQRLWLGCFFYYRGYYYSPITELTSCVWKHENITSSSSTFKPDAILWTKLSRKLAFGGWKTLRDRRLLQCCLDQSSGESSRPMDKMSDLIHTSPPLFQPCWTQQQARQWEVHGKGYWVVRLHAHKYF